jgi:hypothetical protein
MCGVDPTLGGAGATSSVLMPCRLRIAYRCMSITSATRFRHVQRSARRASQFVGLYRRALAPSVFHLICLSLAIGAASV